MTKEGTKNTYFNLKITLQLVDEKKKKHQYYKFRRASHENITSETSKYDSSCKPM